jgi:acetyltransferase/esterase
MSGTVSSGVVEMDGANIYFERRGSGPPLLLIVGGGGDAGAFGALADVLSDQYTVLTYDRRGHSRSPFLGGSGKFHMAEHSADAVGVIKANGFDSAHIFGNSSGAIIGLDLAAFHPEAVEALVAHEPPVISVLPDAADQMVLFDELSPIIEKKGWQAGFKHFLTMNGLVPKDDPNALLVFFDPEKVIAPSPQLDLQKRLRGNWEYFTVGEMRQVVEYVPDLDKIAHNVVQHDVRLALAGGVESRGRFFYRTGQVIAERLGAEFVEFAGDHVAPAIDPVGFGSKLREHLGRNEGCSVADDGQPQTG